MVPTTANAWMDIDSPGEYTNDNTPLIKGDAEINFFIGIHSYLGCTNLGIDSGACIPYFFFHPTAGYTDVTADLYKQFSSQHWCEDICSGTITDIDLGTPTPPIDDLLAYSEPYSWTAPKLSDGSWRLVVHHYGEDAPSPDLQRTFFIDTRAPSGTTITAQPPLFSNDTTPTFDWTASDPSPSSGLDFQCSLDGGAWTACPNDKTFNTPEGNHTLLVKAVDKAGNEDPTPDAYAWMVDTTPPELTINQPLSKGRYLLHEVPAADTSCSDPLSGGPPAVASGIDTCGSSTPINGEDLGAHKFTLSATDKAGNSSTKSIAYVVDPPDYGDFVGNDDPLAYYRLAEAVGSSNMLDSSGNNHHGIYQNGIALGRNGATACERRPHPPRVCELANATENKAGYFPARDGHGYVNGITAPTTGYSMEAWVKPRDGANMMVVSHGGGGQLFIQGGNLAFRQVQDTINSNGAVPPGVWTHVAATWDGHNTRLYVNGVQVAHSTTANKPPSGTSTFYVGYGEMAPWFHGDLDEVAYYDHALSQHAFEDRHKIGVAKDQPSVEAGNTVLNTEGPFTDPNSPKNNGLYAPGKTPVADFTCTDPDDVPGNSDIASCTATVDGNPIANGDTLPDSLGVHVFTVTAIDEGGNQYIHNHTYTVKVFADLFNTDAPVAYCRLGDPAGGPMLDSSANGRHGIYKNAQDSGPLGISGDGDYARDFFGTSGYGYINGVAAPKYQSTLEAWVKPLGDPDPVSTDFVGGSNPAGWSVRNVWNPGGTAGVSDNVLYANGASFGTNGTYGSGRTLSFVANIPAEAFTHVGFGADYNDAPWAMFSVKGDGRLYARTSNGVDPALENDLGTGFLGASHRFTIEWHGDRVVYYVDGDPVAVHAVGFGATQMRPLVSNFNAGGQAVAVDWLRMSPYANRNQSIVGHGDAGEIYIKDGYFRFRHMDTTVISSVAAVPGVWQQVVGTWDGVDLRIYVNGVETGKTEATKRPSSVSTFYVGYGELAPWFNGSIDEVAYYGTALPVNRVYQHFLADPPPEESASKPSAGSTEPANSGGGQTGKPGGTDPGESEPEGPGPDDPGYGYDPDEPVTDNPKDPIVDEPIVNDKPGSEPGSDPDDGKSESGGPVKKPNRSKAAARAKAKRVQAKVKKCKKISKKSKRRACLKRVRS